ncbi:DUF7372 domain-containing protein [Mycolicibacterium septicum]|uniref:DUF7372 domain-containing protein n=1 Tax=Mycolicibacterium septicum TaxID=98668 RepID=UPI001AF0B5EF|nr:hypothetical protein [Mycolicibacterium septicum]QRY51826.1 hypothetical protein JVX95_31380 [Mycolicibacterium septicum]
MRYELSYDQREVVYTVKWNGGEEVFTMNYVTQLWPWLSTRFEPGDSLEWVREG